jgi:endonuclease-3
MSASNRAALLAKTLKVLKKHYKPVAPPSDRSVLEHLLYACCLENSRHEDVDEVMAKLQQSYFDWNEVRVTTVSELAEVMSVLTDPSDAATRLKRTLHSVFESRYAFDLEHLRKQNLGAAIKELEGYNGVTPFAASYVTQNALGGHAIPVNRGVLEALVVLGAVTAADAQQQRVPGLERAIGKNKGVEFGSLLHQMGVDYTTSPFTPRIRSVLLEIDPEAKHRLPKRGTGKKGEGESEPPEAAPRAAKKRASPPRKAPSLEEPKKSQTKRLSRRKPR